MALISDWKTAMYKRDLDLCLINDALTSIAEDISNHNNFTQSCIFKTSHITSTINTLDLSAVK